MVSGDSCDGACFKFDKQTWRQKSNGTQKAIFLKNYSYAKKNTSPEQKLGRPRSMSIFEEFILTLMRLRLGLFQKDLAHRFNVSETTVSTVFTVIPG